MPAIGLVRAASADPVVRGIQLAEARASDLKFRMRGAIAPNPAVVVVAVDEKSAQKFGLWPWPRDRMAKAIEHLVDGGARAIGLDMIFTDPAADDGQIFRELLTRFDSSAPDATGALADFRKDLVARGGASPDDALAAAFKKAGPRLVQGIVAYPAADAKDFTEAKRAEQAALLKSFVIRDAPGPGGTTLELPVEKIEALVQQSAQTPLAAFTQAGNTLGHFNFVIDVDGTLRCTPALLKLTEPSGFLPSMPLKASAIWLGAQIIPHWDRDQPKLTGVELKSADKSVFWPF